jgi:hypothetical protein
MSEAQTIPAKYIFLDVVRFSHERSVEAQTDIVYSLNNIVKKSISKNQVSDEKLILLPTGDGICIALLNIEEPFDIHMRIALDILGSVAGCNAVAVDEMRKYKVRIGINASTDNLVVDINGNRNIAGYGINTAQRIMGLADGNQILVGQSVFDILHARESYMPFFTSFQATVKHGEPLWVYQYIDGSKFGLDTHIPDSFVELSESKLPSRVARYFAHAIKNRGFFLPREEGLFAIKILLLWICAGSTDHINDSNLEKRFESYSQMLDSLAMEFANLIIHDHLFKYTKYFEEYNMWLVNPKGEAKLRREWPDIWNEFFENKSV